MKKEVAISDSDEGNACGAINFCCVRSIRSVRSIGSIGGGICRRCTKGWLHYALRKFETLQFCQPTNLPINRILL